MLLAVRLLFIFLYQLPKHYAFLDSFKLLANFKSLALT